MRLPRGPGAARCLDDMTITTVFAFESESVGKSRREHITIILVYGSFGVGTTNARGMVVRQGIYQSERTFIGWGWRMLGTLCFATTSSPVQAPPGTGPIY